jgi:hypothetical protein
MPTPINSTSTAGTPVDATGTILEYSTDSGTTWLQIANLLDIKPHKRTAGKRKTTTHSTTGGVNTYKAMLGEPGTTEFVLLYDKTAYGVIAALWRTSGVQWRVTMGDSATDKVNGFLSEYGPGTPLDGDATIECKVEHSGTTTLVTS